MYHFEKGYAHIQLKYLNQNKSVNGISPRVLRECYKVLALPICRLLKKISHLCVWPSNCKEGRVSGVWKRDSKSDPKNNRPITVLDNLSLVFERVVDKQLTNFLQVFVPDSQFNLDSGKVAALMTILLFFQPSYTWHWNQSLRISWSL